MEAIRKVGPLAGDLTMAHLAAWEPRYLSRVDLAPTSESMCLRESQVAYPTARLLLCTLVLSACAWMLYILRIQANSTRATVVYAVVLIVSLLLATLELIRIICCGGGLRRGMVSWNRIQLFPGQSHRIAFLRLSRHEALESWAIVVEPPNTSIELQLWLRATDINDQYTDYCTTTTALPRRDMRWRRQVNAVLVPERRDRTFELWIKGDGQQDAFVIELAWCRTIVLVRSACTSAL